MKTALLLLFATAALMSGCATARHAVISPELTSSYEKIVSYEDGLPETWRTDIHSLAFVGYKHRNADHYEKMKREWERCVGQMKTQEPAQSDAMFATLYTLQRRYGATFLSIALMNERPTIQQSNEAMLHYVKAHPELRLTEIAQFYLVPPKELTKAQAAANR